MRLIKTEYFELFKKRGVPATVLLAQHPDDITRHVNIVEVPKDTGSIVLDKKKQVGAFELFVKKCGSKKLSEAPFMIVASRSYDFIANQYALLAVANLTRDYGHSFYWHTLYGNPQDYLRDTKEPTELKDCHLLVLSNLAENSTNMKVEKVRDILEKYSHVPRLLTVGGVDPVLYSKQYLHTKPDFFISC